MTGKIILNKNKEMPFIQYKKHVYKYDKNTMVKMEDEDYATLFKHIEYLVFKMKDGLSNWLKFENTNKLKR